MLRMQIEREPSRPGPQVPDPWRDRIFDVFAELILANPDARYPQSWEIVPEWVTEERMDRLVELIRRTDDNQRGGLMATFGTLTHTWGWGQFGKPVRCGTGLMSLTPEQRKEADRRFWETNLARQNEGLPRLLAWWDENRDAGYEAWASAAIERAITEQAEDLAEYQREIDAGVYEARASYLVFADTSLPFKGGMREEMGAALAEAYDTCDPRCRPLVLAMLGASSTSHARAVLARALRDPDPVVLDAACDVIRGRGDGKDSGFAGFDVRAGELLTHPADHVRRAASWAIAVHPSFDSCGVMLRELAKDEHFVGDQLRTALAKLAMQDPDRLAAQAEDVSDGRTRRWILELVEAARAWRVKHPIDQ